MKQLRTSLSDPLRIDNIVLPDVEGRIGMTLCPGKCGTSFYGYEWQRDLDVDMQAVQSWGADVLVTLMESEELQIYQADNIGEQCMRTNIEWYHLPIRDVDTPDQQFEKMWAYAGLRLKRSLQSGDNILLHCRGGLGRTGTVAARLLIEFGWDPEKAIKVIREIRPGAIETLDQEMYAQSCLTTMNKKDERQAKMTGCLLGGAIGDGLGYIVEFDSIDEIKRNYGHRGISNPVVNGEIIVSDDTQMTLFTMEGLLRSRSVSSKSKVEEVRNAYLDWFGTQIGMANKKTVVGSLAFSPILQITRAPGNTCMGALAEGGNGTPDNPINKSKGCGSVMRVAPVGLLTNNMEPQEVFELGMLTGALTHGHMTSCLSAGTMAFMISGLMKGGALQAVAYSSLSILSKYPDHEETSLAMTKALQFAERKNADHLEVINWLWGDNRLKENTSRGWVAEEALAIGLYSALQGTNYPNVIQIAANHNGDSDSTASIAGQLYGAWKGIDAIPHEWVIKLDVFKEIVGLIALASESIAITGEINE